jgi:hypothetical protein
MDGSQIRESFRIGSKADASRVSPATVSTAGMLLVSGDFDTGVAQPALRIFREGSGLDEIFQRELQRMRGIQVHGTRLDLLNRFVGFTEQDPHLLLAMVHEGIGSNQRKAAQKCSDSQRQQTPEHKKGAVLQLLPK